MTETKPLKGILKKSIKSEPSGPSKVIKKKVKLQDTKSAKSSKNVKLVTKKKLVKKSVKEQLLSMDRKERKEFLKQLKAKKKPHFERGEQCKKLWEKLRSGRTTKDVKEESVEKLLELVKGHAADLIYSHDTVRVIECLVSLKRSDINEMLFEELKPELVTMVKSKYARFFILRILKNGTMDQRREIHNAFEGHFTTLYRNAFSAPVIERLYVDYSMQKKKRAIACEFFGNEYLISKKTTGKVVTIDDVEQMDKQKQILIAQNLYSILEGVVEKEHIRFSLTHRLLYYFFRLCTKEQRVEMIDHLKELIPQFCHTPEGSRAALYCVWNGSAKDRKIIIKSFRELVVNSCKDEFAHRVLLGIFDSVDDTALINKFITKDIGNYIGDIMFEKYGQWVLHYIVFPRDYRFFLKGTLELLKMGDDNEYTKKSKEIRYKEIFDAFKKPVLTYMAANMEKLLFNKLTSVLILNILQPPVQNEPFKRTIDDEDKIACFKAIAEVANKEYVPYDMEAEPHIIETGCGRFTLMQLLKHDKEQETIKLSDYMADIPTEILASFTSINNGCFALLHMFNSKSEKAKEAVKNAINTKKLKKLSFQGAIHLLEALSK